MEIRDAPTKSENTARCYPFESRWGRMQTNRVDKARRKRNKPEADREGKKGWMKTWKQEETQITQLA